MIVGVVLCYATFATVTQQKELDERGFWIAEQSAKQLINDEVNAIVRDLIKDRFTGTQGAELSKRIEAIERAIGQAKESGR